MITSFFRALTLEERLLWLQQHSDQAGAHAVDTGLAEWRLRAWRSQKPFQDREWFHQRLLSSGFSEQEFLEVLSLPADQIAVQAPETPQWMAQLLDAYRCFQHSAPMVPAALAENPEGALLYAVEPVIRWFETKFTVGASDLVDRFGDVPFMPRHVLHMLFPTLWGRLLKMISKTLVLELHAQRLRGRLDGRTEQERFFSFIEQLRDADYALSILSEYPVLGRLVVEYAASWCEVSLEFLEHLACDFDRIRATFFNHSDPGPVVDLVPTAGDRHRKGRSVMIVTFGRGQKLVYKPRGLGVDRHFQALLAWIEQRGGPSLQRLQLLDCGSYGWVEFAPYASCEWPEEVKRFYTRIGNYLALLYVLRATDFHHENIVACGENPILVDLESLFTPRLPGEEPSSGEAEIAMAESVLSTGLLPVQMWIGRLEEAFDISGLSSAQGVLSPHPQAQIDLAGSDKMRVVHRHVPIEEAQNLPRLQGDRVQLLDYEDAIVAGFDDMYRFLLVHRDELAAPAGPLLAFAGDEVRFLFRMTATYTHLMTQSYHPDKLRDGLDQDLHWDHLWAGAPDQPLIAPVIAAEREAGLRSDVPLFTTKPNSLGLWWEARRGLPHYFEISGMAAVLNRLTRLSNEDCRHQLWFIRAALATSKHARHKPPKIDLAETRHHAVGADLMAMACAVGDRLVETAMRSKGQANWVGLCLTDHNRFTLLPLGLDLYSGLPGQALFLSYLGAVTGASRYAELAHESVAAILHRCRSLAPAWSKLGAFIGMGGVVYALAHAATALQEGNWLDEAEAILAEHAAVIEHDDELDIVSGVAGCVGGVLALHAHRPSTMTFDILRCCGNRLLATARPMPRGMGWPVPEHGVLTGFAHGAAGIAWALTELAAVTGESNFAAAARRGIEYERSTFQPEKQIWADLRVDKYGAPISADDTMTAWCNGAVGIGLSRIRMMQLMHDPDFPDEIDTALQATRRAGFGLNHSLCHGDPGNLELLGQAGAHLEQRQRAAAVLDSIARQGFVCGVPTGVETPGLMTGITGIGYACLRMAQPHQVPAVLLLEPP